MKRVTRQDLQLVVDRINDIAGPPSLTRPYSLDFAYGGVQLVQGDGAINVLGAGHLPARDLHDRMQAFICGMCATNKNYRASPLTAATPDLLNLINLINLLEKATFIIETVAHLQGKERDLLPLADASRTAIARARWELVS